MKISIIQLFVSLLLFASNAHAQQYSHEKNSSIEFTSALPSLSSEEDSIRSNPLYQQANQLISQKQYYAAISLFDSLYPSFKQSKLLLLGRGMCYKKVANYTLAMNDYNAILAKDSLFAVAWSNRGMLHMAMGNLELALVDYDRSIQLAPEEAGMYYNRFFAHFYMDNLEEACQDLTSALANNFTEKLGPEAQEIHDYYCQKE